VIDKALQAADMLPRARRGDITLRVCVAWVLVYGGDCIPTKIYVAGEFIVPEIPKKEK